MLTSLLFFCIQPGARREAQLCRTSATTVRAESRGRLPTYRVTVIYPPPLPFTLGDEVLGVSSPPEVTFTPECCFDLSLRLFPHQPSPTPPPPYQPARSPTPHPEVCVWCCGHFLHHLSRRPGGGVICHECSSDLYFEVVAGSYLC